MSTNEDDIYPARGQTTFDAGSIAKLRQQLTLGAISADSQAINAYRAFYHLIFTCQHSHQMFPLKVAAQTVAAQYFLPASPQGYVLLCHGYYDHVGLYRYPIEYFLSRDIAVITFDQLGHGLSSGERVTIDDFQQYTDAGFRVLERAVEDLGLSVDQPIHLCGQSMGGSVVMDMVRQHGDLSWGEIVLLAPLVKPYAWWLSRWLFEIAKRTVSERPRTIANNADNAEFMALQHADPLQEHTLPVAWVQAMVNWQHQFLRWPAESCAPKIVQGQADRTVSWRVNRVELSRRYPSASWLMIPAAGHHLANESADIRRQVWHWLDQHCSWH